jgi:hypothetical protein
MFITVRNLALKNANTLAKGNPLGTDTGTVSFIFN